MGKIRINFKHPLINRRTIRFLSENLSEFEELIPEENGSITIICNIAKKEKIEHDIRNLFEDFEENFVQTKRHSYEIPDSVINFMKEWFISFEGAIALILLFKFFNLEYLNGNWTVINSRIGGISIGDYTILLYGDHAKIIHPVSFENYLFREKVEKEIAIIVSAVVDRVKDSQPGFEGEAMLSYVEEKTNLSKEKIAEEINDKTLNVRLPRKSPIFNA